jgi:hypothetical protein
MPLNDEMTEAKVIGRAKDKSGNPVGVSHSNPLQDTRVYEVKFPDGPLTEYSANLIATAMFAQVDDDGNTYNIMDEIVDHRKTREAVLEDEAFVTIRGKVHPVRTTKGWEMCVLWKNGDTSWEKLKDMKEANSIEAAEYAVTKGISEEPAFNWWAKHTLKKRDSIISLVRARFIRRDSKFGIKVPSNIAEARALDVKNGDNFWEQSVEKEMKNVRVAFKVLDDGVRVPVGYQRIPCMLIFDVDGFHAKDKTSGGRPCHSATGGADICQRGIKGVGKNGTPTGGPQRHERPWRRYLECLLECTDYGKGMDSSWPRVGLRSWEESDYRWSALWTEVLGSSV